MEINQDVLRGTLLEVSGAVLNKRGRIRQDHREMAVGQLRRTAGALQRRRGVVTARLERARRRLTDKARERVGLAV